MTLSLLALGCLVTVALLASRYIAFGRKRVLTRAELLKQHLSDLEPRYTQTHPANRWKLSLRRATVRRKAS